MQIESKIVEIPNNNLSTEYVESYLKDMGIVPLRWAIVGVDKERVTISLAYQS